MVLHGNDESVVNKIVELKLQAGEFKPHPDAPDDPQATLYNCVIGLERVEEDEHAEQLVQEVSGNGTGPEARPLYHSIIPHPKNKKL